MFHLLFGPLLPNARSNRLSEFAAIGQKLSAASLLLYPRLHQSSEASREVTGLAHEAIGFRRRLEARLARGVHVIDSRLICEAASEMVQVVRLIARVVRCREWLRLDAPPAEVLELEGAAARSGQLVAESALTLATSGKWLGEPHDSDFSRGWAEELYNRGVARAFAEFPDPIEVLRQRAHYDALFNVVLGSDRALEAVRNASLE